MSDPTKQTWSFDTDSHDPETLTATFLDYLTMVADQRAGNHRDPLWVWHSHEALLLSMAGAPVLVETLTLPPMVEAGAVKECFYNAFMLSVSHRDLVYTEGYAMAGGLFPMNHAWCVDQRTGTIVDPTWTQLHNNTPVLYLGLSFSRRFMFKALDEGNDVPSVFESDWQRGMKTLRHGLVYGTDGLIDDWGDPPPF